MRIIIYLPTLLVLALTPLTNANASVALACVNTSMEVYCKLLGQADIEDDVLPKEWEEFIPLTLPIIKTLTDSKITSLLNQKKEQFSSLAQIEKKHQLPVGTLRVKWLIESVAGEVNIRNKHGYTGHFQLGDYEANKYGVKDRHDLLDSAEGTVNMLKDYSQKSGIGLNSVWDCYGHHQQGYRGIKEIYRAIDGKPLSKKVKRNMLNNIPKRAYPNFFKPNTKVLKLTDQEFAQAFKTLWEGEIQRILSIVLKG